MSKRKLYVVQGFSSHDSVFFICGRAHYRCDFNGEFYKDAKGLGIFEKTATDCEHYFQAESFEKLWFKYSDPGDIRSYRSPVSILMQYDYKDVVDSDRPVLVDFVVMFNGTYAIYACIGNDRQKICGGKLSKCAWDMNAQDVEQIANENEDTVVDYLTSHILQVA